MNHTLRTRQLAVFAALCLAAVQACAQTTNQDAATIQALLTEVRQLRLALERSALATPKIQLTLQRIQSEEQKVARISAQLDVVRRQIADQTASAARSTDELTLMDERISSEMDAVRRKQMEERRAEIKLNAACVIDPALKARESEIAASLQTEQAALDDLNQKLNAMERLLDTPPATAR